MAEPRDDAPLEDVDEQQRGVDSSAEESEAGTGAGLSPGILGADANEADVLEQQYPVPDDEEYARDVEDE